MKTKEKQRPVCALSIDGERHDALLKVIAEWVTREGGHLDNTSDSHHYFWSIGELGAEIDIIASPPQRGKCIITIWANLSHLVIAKGAELARLLIANECVMYPYTQNTSQPEIPFGPWVDPAPEGD